MDIVFVGAGRLATNVARALKAQGDHRVVAVYSRTLASAEALVHAVGGMATDDIASLPLTADAFIIAVKDDALPAVVDRLQQGREGQLFFHTAGSVPMSVFGTHEPCGVFYPMQTFSKERQVDFSRVPLFIEGSSEQALAVARAIAQPLSSPVYELSSEGRRRLHLSAVFACNFVNHCYDMAAQLLQPYGVPFSVLLPLIDETAEKVHAMSPREAQTGPAVRYDERVMAAQRDLLNDHPLMQQLYALMSESIHRSVLNSDF